MKQTKKVRGKRKRGLTKKLREIKKRKRKYSMKRGGGNFLLPFWQGMLLELNDLAGVNKGLTDTIRHNLSVMSDEELEKNSWGKGGGGKKKNKRKTCKKKC